MFSVWLPLISLCSFLQTKNSWAARKKSQLISKLLREALSTSIHESARVACVKSGMNSRTYLTEKKFAVGCENFVMLIKMLITPDTIKGARNVHRITNGKRFEIDAFLGSRWKLVSLIRRLFRAAQNIFIAYKSILQTAEDILMTKAAHTTRRTSKSPFDHKVFYDSCCLATLGRVINI